ncbi:Asp23/Gls24 family envelope stress response protein [Cellulomonas sp. ACRRI]|uniref:Asp23/Gls24 family envelope stress response protein n=1 Tax=Cellulomonas sp. ACRRI TaxID=2918188 RepID=UPI001EF1A6E4|nr:Asp23/Gls24 family envelope stress response protein [Cellulomonas sp. ACRRI]MCG7284542.1 Asp23/Gls24 family envelope stress response protein [Cellulomonas sp. ACRRI]
MAGTTPTQAGTVNDAQELTPKDRTRVVASALTTDRGTTTIADTVVSKIAGIAARDVAGVHDVGGGAQRAFGAFRERIPGGSTNYSQGVSVEVGQSEAAVDVDIVAEYGVAIADVAEAVRRSVVTGIERMTGLRVIEVNVSVNDVWLPQEDDQDGEPAPSRVQ